MEVSRNIYISSSTERIFASAGVLGILGGVSAVAYFDPTQTRFFPVCPLLTITGFACPGCGMTRGLHALSHGDIFGALDFNALLPLYLLFFGYLFISLALLAVRGRGLRMSVLNPKILYGILVVMLGFAFLRNLPVYPFSILYP